MGWLPAGHALDLFEGLLESMAVKGIAVERIDSQYPVLDGTGDHGHLAAESYFLWALPLAMHSTSGA